MSPRFIHRPDPGPDAIAILSLDLVCKRAILSLVKTIILTPSAAKDIDALPRDAREQVEAGLHRYAMTGQGDVKALQGRDGLHRSPDHDDLQELRP